MTRTLAELLEILPGGDISWDDLYGFSSLKQAEAESAWAVWSTLPTDVRRRTARMLVEIAESDIEADFGEIFRRALRDEDAQVRRAAVEGLWEDEDVHLVPLLVACLQRDPDAEVRAEAAISLGRFLLMGELGKIRPRPHNQAFQALLTTCTTPGEESEVRRRALESLSYSSEAVVAELIRETYESADERARASAIFAMGRSGDERWADQVLQELGNVGPEMRYEAAHACGELSLEEAIPTLVELVEDVDDEVREAAMWALGQIGGDEARRVLQSCARSGDEPLRTAAQDALRELEFLHGDLGTLLLNFFEEDEEEEGEEELW